MRLRAKEGILAKQFLPKIERRKGSGRDAHHGQLLWTLFVAVLVALVSLQQAFAPKAKPSLLAIHEAPPGYWNSKNSASINPVIGLVRAPANSNEENH